MTDLETLKAAVLENPASAAARGVYADKLRESECEVDCPRCGATGCPSCGGPWRERHWRCVACPECDGGGRTSNWHHDYGEFIGVQLRLADPATPHDGGELYTALKRREAELWQRLNWFFHGVDAGRYDTVAFDDAASAFWSPASVLTVLWSRGFPGIVAGGLESLRDRLPPIAASEPVTVVMPSGKIPATSSGASHYWFLGADEDYRRPTAASAADLPPDLFEALGPASASRTLDSGRFGRSRWFKEYPSRTAADAALSAAILKLARGAWRVSQ